MYIYPDTEYDRLCRLEKDELLKHDDVMMAPSRRKKGIVDAAKATTQPRIDFIRAIFIPIIIGCIIVGIIMPPVGTIAAIIYVIFYIESLGAQKQAINTALSDASNELLKLEHLASIAQRNVEETKRRYERLKYEYCAQMNAYPPDWDMRRRIVLKRDNNKCTNCGWSPDGNRKTRQLHVHHKVAISAGGTNSIDNLATLCHICHRKVDKNHSHIRIIRRGDFI